MHYFFVCYSVIFWNERQFCIFWTVLLQVCFTTFGRQTNRPWIAEGVLVIASILSSEVCFNLYKLLILTSSSAARHPSVKVLRRPFIFWLYSCKIWLLTLIDSPLCTWWLVELFITKTGNQPITRGRFF